MTGTLVRLLAALSAGVGAWCSLGVLAVAHTGGRLGILPPTWLLGVTVVVSCALVIGLRWRLSRALPLFASLAFVLPWVPGTTVAPFLLFTGPTAGLWWTLIAAACLAGEVVRAPAVLRAAVGDPRRAPWIAAAVVAVVAGSAAVHIREWLPFGDEPHYLVITQSLIHDGDLQIENNHERGDYEAYHPGGLPPDYLRRGVNGQIYSIHAPGLSALVVPAFLVAGYPGVVAFLILCGALGAALSWWLGYTVTGNAAAAWMGWAVVTTSITFMAHTFTVFPDGLSGVFVLVGVWALFLRADAPAWRVGLHSAAVAILPWLHTRNAPVALVIGFAVGWSLWRRQARRALVTWLTPLAIGALSWLTFFKVVYGVFDPSAPYGGYTQSTIENVPRGLVGLLFDQQFGVLAYAPALAIGIVGTAMMLWPSARGPASATDEHVPVGPRALALIMLATALPYLGLASSYAMWWGGASAPARFLTPIVLLLAIPSAVAWARCRSRAARAVMVGLVVSSAVMLAALLTMQDGGLLINRRDGYGALVDWASPVADLSLALPAVHRDPLNIVFARALVWIAVPLVCWAAGQLLTRLTTVSRGATGLTLLVTAMVASGLATHVSWSMRGIRGPRFDGSQVRLVTAAADAGPRALPVVFRDAPRNDGFGRTERRTKVVAPDDLVGRLSISTSLRHRPADTAFAAGPLPGGRYRMRATTTRAEAGALDVLVGGNGAALRHLTWSRPEGAATATVDFDLVLPVRLVSVRGDAEALSAVSEVVLQPLQVSKRDDRLGRENVERLAANGANFVYLLSDAVYVESDGIWLGPLVDVPMVVEPAGPAGSGPLRIFLRNGPFENEVTLTGTAAESIVLAPHEERLVPLAVTWIDGAARVVIRASRGFRPYAVDATSDDRRLLGVWIALP